MLPSMKSERERLASPRSKWAHGDNNEDIIGFGGKPNNGISDSELNRKAPLIANDKLLAVKNGSDKNPVGSGKKVDVVLAKKGNSVPSRRSASSKKRSKKSERSLRGKTRKQKTKTEVEVTEMDEQEQEIPKLNTSYGLLVGPFGSTEDRVLEWSPEKRSGTCDRRGELARLVWSRKFVLIFHELSMTGAPLSMMELATELLSCGATVSAVVLSKKGGLVPELARRRIKVLEDRADLSFKTAMKADLVIAGSAVCASWIGKHAFQSLLAVNDSSLAVWTISPSPEMHKLPMNLLTSSFYRMACLVVIDADQYWREYFDRSKLVINRVKMLIFLSESQSKQWLTWCKEENISLISQPAVVPLSVNDELAFVAGITCSLNTPSFTTEKMQEKRRLLRDSIRKEMGLTDTDMLLLSLSSINPGKGQFFLLESVRSMIEQEPSQDDPELKDLAKIGQDQSNFSGKHYSRALLQKSGLRLSNESFIELNGPKRTQEQALKVLIGSVGSKSNKVPYVKGLLRFLTRHSNLSKSVLWTPATTRVASLYSAADVYVINSQWLQASSLNAIGIDFPPSQRT
ncbi:hypothetical protein CK203_084382 [Vitis vinifera]|uniref:Uncharacterized protein n=1 Tax=Vitis vinifera TaxID=29760 RepID=A0A438DF66_VITVI|nr:hypothetical protein CK203_084382 [Vitis vinifera]